MRRNFILNPNEKYDFVVGQQDNYLIMRNLSDDIKLKIDTDTTMQLTRSDTVIVSKLQNQNLTFFNDSNNVISGEFQLSEIEIRIKEQNIGVSGSNINVDNINNPVTVKPLNITDIKNPVVVSEILKFPKLKLSQPTQTFGDLITAGGGDGVFNAIQSIRGRNIKYMSFYVDESAGGSIFLDFIGLKLNAGDFYEIKENFVLNHGVTVDDYNDKIYMSYILGD